MQNLLPLVFYTETVLSETVCGCIWLCNYTAQFDSCVSHISYYSVIAVSRYVFCERVNTFYINAEASILKLWWQLQYNAAAD